jgi:hypothetical protein
MLAPPIVSHSRQAASGGRDASVQTAPVTTLARLPRYGYAGFWMTTSPPAVTKMSGLLVAVLLAACEAPAPTATPTDSAVTLDGIPVQCAPMMERDVCLARAEVGTRGLTPGHPPLRSIQVTCNAALCDEDEGAGQIRIFFVDGTHEFSDFAFGHT